MCVPWYGHTFLLYFSIVVILVILIQVINNQNSPGLRHWHSGTGAIAPVPEKDLVNRSISNKNTTQQIVIRKCNIFDEQLSLQWRHDERDGVSNHQSHDRLLKRLFRRRSKKTSKLCVTGHCEGNSLVTVESPAQRASNAENVSIWWRHHVKMIRWHVGEPHQLSTTQTN